MNILVTTAYPPVLHWHGGGVRMYHNIRILSQKHNVHVLSFVGSDQEQQMLESVKPICDSIKGIRRIPDFRPHWLSVTPFMVREFSTPAMHQAVDDTIRSKGIDVVQCEYLQMAQFRRNVGLSVMTAHEALSRNAYESFERESDPVEKVRLFYRWMQMLRYEVMQLGKFDRVVTMTEDDARYLRSYAPKAKILAVPIGIDADEFSPHAEDDQQQLTAVFVGNFNHSPNVEAARFLAQQMAPRFPNVTFNIHGVPLLPDFKSSGNVFFPGYVADTRQLYRRPNTIMVAPLFSGTGQRVKLLEAFAMACPVITTTVGAMGFPIQHGVQAMIADTVDDFAAALRRLTASRQYRMQLGNEGRHMILERFTWNRISEELWSVVTNTAVSN